MNNTTKYKLISSLLIIVIGIVGYFLKGEEKHTPLSDGNIRIHFIDVGQGDSTLIELPGGKTMLVDAGEADKGNDVVEYIEEYNIRKIDFLVGTHPHSDHIGGMAEIVEKFEIGNVYMPKVLHNSAIFENLLETVKKKGLKVKTPLVGEKIFDDNETEVVVLSPSRASYEELNNYSVVLKITHKQKSFLLTGDAENEALNEIKELGKIDVLKVPHHGSNTSVSKLFYEKILPEYGVISVGKNNSYGHPHKEVIKLFEEFDIKCLRTDLEGTIVIETDGNKLEFMKSGE